MRPLVRGGGGEKRRDSVTVAPCDVVEITVSETLARSHHLGALANWKETPKAFQLLSESDSAESINKRTAKFYLQVQSNRFE
jgi:hypothetical protein